MRTASLHVLPFLLAACGGDDLLLPSGSAAGLEAVSGDRQEAPVGAELRQPLVVRATDAGGRPVEGALVVFRFDGDVGGRVAPDTALTGADGLASAAVRLGTMLGAQLVDAVAVDAPEGLIVTFRLIALARPNNGGGGGGGDDGGGGGGGGGGNDDGGGGSGGGGGGGESDDGGPGGGGGDDDDDDEDEDDEDGADAKDKGNGKGKGKGGKGKGGKG